MTDRLVRRHDGAFHWEDVEVLEYKRDGSAPFKGVTRQVLFEDADLPSQLRYFEVAPGGWTTLERHEHVHAVMVIRGRGQCLVGDKSYEIKLHDLVRVPPMTWHQFHAASDETLGFLCMVASDRDRPQLPEASQAGLIAGPLNKTRSR
ncbi:MAG TPA: cupin domain-containing protein [Usitatibacter sp.]|nr:cupin domain-containing protein [Usitatibacter sp.]